MESYRDLQGYNVLRTSALCTVIDRAVMVGGRNAYPAGSSITGGSAVFSTCIMMSQDVNVVGEESVMVTVLSAWGFGSELLLEYRSVRRTCV